jgi:hypothetical protein
MCSDISLPILQSIDPWWQRKSDQNDSKKLIIDLWHRQNKVNLLDIFFATFGLDSEVFSTNYQ